MLGTGEPSFLPWHPALVEDAVLVDALALELDDMAGGSRWVIRVLRNHKYVHGVG